MASKRQNSVKKMQKNLPALRAKGLHHQNIKHRSGASVIAYVWMWELIANRGTEVNRGQHGGQQKCVSKPKGDQHRSTEVNKGQRRSIQINVNAGQQKSTEVNGGQQRCVSKPRGGQHKSTEVNRGQRRSIEVNNRSQQQKWTELNRGQQRSTEVNGNLKAALPNLERVQKSQQRSTEVNGGQ